MYKGMDAPHAARRLQGFKGAAILGPVNANLKAEFQAKWKADVDAYYAERKRALDIEHQKARQEVDRFWSDAENGDSPPAPADVPQVTEGETPPAVPQPHTSAPSRLASGLTRRQAVREIIFGFQGAAFTVNDIIERYLEYNPDGNSPHLRHDISRMLRQRYRDPGDNLVVVREPDLPTEANVYREVQRQDEQPRDGDPGDAGDGTGSSPDAQGAADGQPQTSTNALNGSSGIPSTKRMVLELLPEFEDAEFTQGGIKEAIVSRWPGADGKHLASSVANALKGLTDSGTLSRRREGDGMFAPYLYRVEHDREGRLLDP